MKLLFQVANGRRTQRLSTSLRKSSVTPRSPFRRSYGWLTGLIVLPIIAHGCHKEEDHELSIAPPIVKKPQKILSTE
jgi:hypothetical protein